MRKQTRPKKSASTLPCQTASGKRSPIEKLTGSGILILLKNSKIFKRFFFKISIKSLPRLFYLSTHALVSINSLIVKGLKIGGLTLVITKQ
jgi:hypothetical protein